MASRNLPAPPTTDKVPSYSVTLGNGKRIRLERTVVGAFKLRFEVPERHTQNWRIYGSVDIATDNLMPTLEAFDQLYQTVKECGAPDVE